MSLMRLTPEVRVCSVNPASPAFSISGSKVTTMWELALAAPKGILRSMISHHELHNLYVDRLKPETVFTATAHRDISRLVFYDRRVVIKVITIVEQPIIDEDKRLTGRWKVGVDLNDVYQIQTKYLVKYYFNGVYHEKEISGKDLKDFIGYRDVVYHHQGIKQQ